MTFLSRRGALALGAGVVAGAAGLALPRGSSAAGAPAAPHAPARLHGAPAARTATHATFTPWTVAMPVPPVLQPVQTSGGVDVYRLPLQAATTEILPGSPTAVRTFGGGFVGPTIRARTGRPVRVAFENRLDVPANVHLHGGHTPAASDGYPMDLIQPGGSRVYDYPNQQRGATLWYHDHSHHTEAENVYLGLHGFYLVDDDAETYLGLPGGAYDVPIALRDANVDETGKLVFNLFEDLDGRPAVLANGKAQPYFPVAARKYRFRLLNSSNERELKLHVESGGQTGQLVQIASDGGLLPAPVPRTEVVIGSAERTEVVVDFAKYPVGSQVLLVDAAAGPLVRFDVVRRAVDGSRVPDRLRPLPALPTPAVTRDVSMSFDLSGELPVGMMDGKPFDANRVDFTVKRGSTEIWRVTNGDGAIGANHTFHLHQTSFRVLDRGGNPLRPDDAGLKDTVQVAPGETVRLQATFNDYLGKYMFHCHFLEHSSLGMMAQLEVVA
ncbi:multicopper oxidase family protein [Amycolatopsis sp. NPDC004747]